MTIYPHRDASFKSSYTLSESVARLFSRSTCILFVFMLVSCSLGVLFQKEMVPLSCLEDLRCPNVVVCWWILGS